MSEFSSDASRQPYRIFDRLKDHKETIGITAAVGVLGLGVAYGLQEPDCEPTGEMVTIGRDIGPYDRPYRTYWEVALAANPNNPDGTHTEDTSLITDIVQAANPELAGRALQDGDEVHTVVCSN